MTACGLDDEDIWMPPSSSGKADGVQILKGSDIPSQYVVPTKHYLTGRTINSLIQVGALSGVPESVAMRADGIIANLPANGRLEGAELVRMENPSIFATLFPNEQAALPTLWPLLEAPAPTAMPVAVPSTKLDVVEQRTPPSGLVPPASILISSLRTEWQMVAKRVQLVFDGDSNAQTIQIADIDQVLVAPEAFTPAEVEQLKQIRQEFMLRATSACDAIAVVPEPGHKATTANLGALTLDFEADLVIHEQRSFTSSNWTARLVVEEKLASTLLAGANDAIVIVALDNGSEAVLNGASNPLPSAAVGEVVIERYVGGQLQQTNLVALPARSDLAGNDITQFLDYKLVTANQTPLVKNVVSTSNGIVDFHYGLTATPNLGDPNMVAAVATPPLTLPTGRYEFAIPYLGTSHALDIYPNGIVFADGHRLLPGSSGGYANQKIVGYQSGQYLWRFTAATNHFHHWLPGRESGITVTLAMRTK